MTFAVVATLSLAWGNAAMFTVLDRIFFWPGQPAVGESLGVMGVIATGIVAGIALALVSGRLMASLLFDTCLLILPSLRSRP